MIDTPPPEATTTTEEFQDFTIEVDKILATNRLSFFSYATFNKNTEQQSRAQLLSEIIPILSVGVAVLILPLAIIDLFVGILGLSLGVLIWGFLKKYSNKPSAMTYNKLLEDAKDPIVASLLLNWAQSLAASQIPLYQKSPTGLPAVVDDKFRRAENMAMVLLGDDRHRKALRYKIRLSASPFLFRETDRSKIFDPLIEALKREGYWNDPDPSTSNTPPPIEKETTPSSIKTEVLTLEPTDKGNLTSPAPSRVAVTSDTRDYRFLITVLLKKRMLGVFLIVAAQDPFKSSAIKQTKHENWINGFQFIYDNWNLWERFRDIKGGDDVKQFSKTLFDEKHFNYTSGNDQEHFRKGMNRRISGFVKKSGAISEKGLVSKDHKIK